MSNGVAARGGKRAKVAVRVGALIITVSGIVTACRNSVPGPTLPNPVTPEVSRGAPKSQPIDPSNAPEARPDARPAQLTRRVSAAAAYGSPQVEPPTKDAPNDAGISDVIDLQPVPDADVEIVTDAATPLK